MRLSIPAHKVIDDQDFFGRRPFGQALTNIISNSSEPLVISIDGNWGEGKTTFIKLWQRMLDSESLPNIYIDAFACDHVDDAFMVVASAITDYIKLKAPPDKADLFIAKAKKVGTHALSLGTKIAIRAISVGIIKESDISQFKKIGEDISKDFGTSAEKYIQERLSNHKTELETIESFKEFLSTLPAELSEKKDSPLTIIIDELDRCRPSFAVEILEKIKHLFSAQNINFVLVINKLQLQESIRTTYGHGIDAHTYLQKFITIEAKLPKIRTNHDNDIDKYCQYLAAAHEVPRDTDISVIFSALGSHFDMSLRQLEKSYSNLAIIALSERNFQNMVQTLACFVSTMKAIKPEILTSLSNGTINFSELCKKLQLENVDEDNNRVLYFIVKWLRFALLSDIDYADAKRSGEDVILSGLVGTRRKAHLDLYISKLNNLRSN